MLDRLTSAASEWRRAKLQLDDLIELYESASAGAADEAKRAARSLRSVFDDLPTTREEVIDTIDEIVGFEESLTGFLEHHALDFDPDKQRAVQGHAFFRHARATVKALNRAIDHLRVERN